ncbi:zinc-binding dehydrogenase [Streptomyces sp. NPDC001852]|uniref:zinc-binding dehydrogenase n=1 Tax=Streptomyces sp. NPDC001852 TaxID=3364619 RepID=UPI0036A20A99
MAGSRHGHRPRPSALRGRGRPRGRERHNAHGVFFIVEPDGAGLESITQLIQEGRLTPTVDRVLPLIEGRAAYEALEREHQRGKIVLHIDD